MDSGVVSFFLIEIEYGVWRLDQTKLTDFPNELFSVFVGTCRPISPLSCSKSGVPSH